MGQPYIGEIRMFGGNFNPNGWAFCDGQLMSISENDALFTLLGTTYGGDGNNTFALPDLRGRVPIHSGQGISNYVLGENGGAESVTLTVQQIPIHTHPALATTSGQQLSPTGAILAQAQSAQSGLRIYSNLTASMAAMNAQTVAPVGGSQPHDNFQPTLCINYIISLFGVFPNGN